MKHATIVTALILIAGTNVCSWNEAWTQAPGAGTPAPNKSASPAATPAGHALTDYDGKQPFKSVGGMALLDHPVVRAEVKKVVADASIRKWVLEAGTSTWSPTFVKAGQLIVTGCQQHACDKRSWAISVDVKTHAARVCYEHSEVSHWYSADGIEPLKGDCPFSKKDFDD